VANESARKTAERLGLAFLEWHEYLLTGMETASI